MVIRDQDHGTVYNSGARRRLRPGDIRGHHFSTRRRGYSVDEVDAFLNAVANEMEVLCRDAAAAFEEARRAKHALVEWQSASARWHAQYAEWLEEQREQGRHAR
jgi:DivIVA domain-containing protein